MLLKELQTLNETKAGEYSFGYRGQIVFDCYANSDEDAIKQYKDQFGKPSKGWDSLIMYFPAPTASDPRASDKRTLTKNGK